MGIDLDLALLVTWQKRQISHTSMENSQRKHLALVSAMVTELEHAQQVYESVEHKLDTYDALLNSLRDVISVLEAHIVSFAQDESDILAAARKAIQLAEGEDTP